MAINKTQDLADAEEFAWFKVKPSGRFYSFLLLTCFLLSVTYGESIITALKITRVTHVLIYAGILFALAIVFAILRKTRKIGIFLIPIYVGIFFLFLILPVVFDLVFMADLQAMELPIAGYIYFFNQPYPIMKIMPFLCWFFLGLTILLLSDGLIGQSIRFGGQVIYFLFVFFPFAWFKLSVTVESIGSFEAAINLWFPMTIILAYIVLAEIFDLLDNIRYYRVWKRLEREELTGTKIIEAGIPIIDLQDKPFQNVHFNPKEKPAIYAHEKWIVKNIRIQELEDDDPLIEKIEPMKVESKTGKLYHIATEEEQELISEPEK